MFAVACNLRSIRSALNSELLDGRNSKLSRVILLKGNL